MEIKKNTEKTMYTSRSYFFNDSEYRLPTHFLTDDDFLSGAGYLSFAKETPKNLDLFSNAFEFDPFGALDSPVSSNGNDKEQENCNDDSELLAELTRQLALSSLREAHRTHTPAEKARIYSTSPQSTLNGFGGWSKRRGFSSNGSPSQVPSPPLTPPETKNDAFWELLYEAAGQVAKLRMNAIAAQLKYPKHRAFLPNSSLTAKIQHLNTLYDHPVANQYQQKLKRQFESRGPVGIPPSAWPPLRAETQQPRYLHHHRHGHRQEGPVPGARAPFVGMGPGATAPVKRHSTGTGVFLPRRIETLAQPPPEPRKKTTGCSTVMVPAKLVQALNINLEDTNSGVNFISHSRFGAGFVPDHEIMFARSNAVLSQQRPSVKPEGAATVVGGHEIRLPIDWTY